MKYQQLENLEAGWKWTYLVKKHKEGFNVTCYVDTSEIDASVKALLALEHEPTKVIEWIQENMSPALDVKLKQAIRAKRKRHFNAEQEHTRKNLSTLISVCGKSYQVRLKILMQRFQTPSSICCRKLTALKTRTKKSMR